MRRRLELDAFLKTLPLAFVVAILCWQGLRPVLDRSTKEIAEALLVSAKATRSASLVFGGIHGVGLRLGTLQPSEATSWTLTAIHFNTVIFLTFAFGLRGAGGRRAWIGLGLGLIVLHLLQGLDLWCQIQYALASGAAGDRFVSSGRTLDLIAFSKHFFALPGRLSLPIVLWASASWPEVCRWLDLDEPSS